MNIQIIKELELATNQTEKLDSLGKIAKLIRENELSENEELVNVILTSLDDESEFVRIKATELAELLKGEKIVDKLLIKVINDSSYYVRGFSAKALGAMGNMKAKVSLEAALRDKEGFVVSFASQALKTINMKLSFSGKLDSLKSKMEESKRE